MVISRADLALQDFPQSVHLHTDPPSAAEKRERSRRGSFRRRSSSKADFASPWFVGQLGLYPIAHLDRSVSNTSLKPNWAARGLASRQPPG